MGSEKLLFRLEQPHGTGDIYIAWQKGSGMYLATTGIDAIVNIFDRQGDVKERIKLPSLCTGLGWDSDGDLLGVISSQPQLILWDSNSMKKLTIDVGLKDYLSCLIWSPVSPILAVGTSKGNVSIYNHNTSRRVPIIGKHSKKITCGVWNTDNILALGSEDKTISVSNLEGDTLRVINLRAEPMDIQFSDMKRDERIAGQNTVSVIVGKRTLFLYNLMDPENPIELAFQQHYGSIVVYKWYGDGYILIGFSSGFFIAISTHIKEVGQELFQVRNHKNTLTDITICEKIGKVASCGDNNVKIHDLSNLKEVSSVLTLAQESGLERVGWSVDGQLLGVCTKGGSLNVYVSHMVTLTSVCAPRIAVLSSLNEISLFNYSADKSMIRPIPVTLMVEPSFIAVGQYHVAAGMNNRIWFYDLTKPQVGTEDSPLMIGDRQYLGVVTSICLNPEYASVMFEGSLQLHMIEQPEVCHEDRETIMFPNASTKQCVITCHALTTDFLVYATDMGQITYFHIEDWAVAGEFSHEVGITDLYVDPAGARLVFLDIRGKGYVYNAFTNKSLEIPDLPSKINGVTWDSNISDRNIFIVYDENEIFTYIYVKFSIDGPKVIKVGVTGLVSKQLPLLMYAGEVMSATSGGQLSQLALSTHDSVQSGINERDSAVLEANFNKQLSLHRFSAAWITCQTLQDKKLFRKIAEECLKFLEIEIAIRAYKELDDVSMVWNLETLRDVEESRLLAGHICMYLKEYDRAQEWFKASSSAEAALQMRRDLLQWDQALQLARKTATDQIAMISREYAQQLEFTGNYPEALMHYENALQENLGPAHIHTCKTGIARSNLHCGNYRHGMSIALELDSKQLRKECADILERKNQLHEAATLYEKCGMYDKAASNHIKLKNWTKVGEILPEVTSSRILLQYARAKEAEGSYEEALDAYAKAKDFDAAIRLHLEHLNNPEIAVDLVQETKSVEGAKLVAKFFQNLNDTSSAIRFLVLSKCTEDAYELAKKTNKMELYGEILLSTFSEDETKPSDFSGIAQYFENDKNFIQAGKYWFHARSYQKAMRLLLKAAKSNAKENDALTIAIDVVASSKDELLASQLIEYLLGETDGLPKDPKYLFRLYMARKQFKLASKSAIIIANEEQINGNYRNAHDVLFAMYQELKQNGIKIPQEMHLNLMLLHSYILVRLHVRRGDHLKGARMLIRVANSISKFPSHVVPILTSTVIECHRAGLKQAAFKYATMLMRPEYRKGIDQKYAKKIEAVVRKPPRNGECGDRVEPLSPCPYCENMVPETEIDCNGCKNHIPFCIVTGRHIVTTDLTACPECDFPALRSEFVEVLDSEDSCPMCSEKVDSRRLPKITDPNLYLNIE
ncbi:unnamed protein product [Brassicogethes aeneus]|uniref:WD repeat-containing protein 19 n=1 Tax=Brassicogethes aeneus TaxID=1431903 RepID=A0A9P0BAN0_BRAAE|nr:unnamed protein product [Brassicogethes aeneus]